MIDHTSNCLTHSLKAAERIHIAMCRLPEDRSADVDEYLLGALQSELIVAEECRQALKDRQAATTKTETEREV